MHSHLKQYTVGLMLNSIFSHRELFTVNNTTAKHLHYVGDRAHAITRDYDESS